eukprot:2893008-Pleurochrysis_carterae.AAC.2
MLFFNSFPTARHTHPHASAIARRRRADAAVPPALTRDAESARSRSHLYSTGSTSVLSTDHVSLSTAYSIARIVRNV